MACQLDVTSEPMTARVLAGAVVGYRRGAWSMIYLAELMVARRFAIKFKCTFLPFFLVSLSVVTPKKPLLFVKNGLVCAGKRSNQLNSFLCDLI